MAQGMTPEQKVHMLPPAPASRVLFVDDEPAILNAVKRLFRREPYEIETASDGASGLEVFRRFRPAVVVSDHRMPGMTGVEFLARARAIDPEPVRIVLTGCTDLPAAESAINEGEVWRFITKPWNDEDLRATVAGAAERFRLVFENRILLDKLASIGLLAGGVAHELNNPIGGILAYAEMLRKDFQGQPETVRDLKLIEDAAVRAKRIIADLLDFARTARASARARVSLEDLAEKAITLVRFQITKDVEIRREFAPGVASVFVDANRIEQVLLNLLSNAVHAVSSGARRGGSIVVRTREAGDRVSIDVGDDGPGIASHQLLHIFDPFFTTKAPGEGTGLGLTVSQGIVRDHGGTLTTASEPGCGATFTMTLPAMPSAADETSLQGDAR